MKSLAQKRPVLLALLCFVGFILLLMLPVKAAYEAIAGVQADVQAELVIKIIRRVVFAMAAAALLAATGLSGVFRLPHGGVLYMLAAGVLLVSANQVPAFFEAQAWSTWAGMPQTVLLTALNCIGVGLFEEFVFRGAIFQLLLKHYGGTRRGTISAVLASGGLFGLVHLVNLIQNPDLFTDTLLQLVYAAVIGVVLAVMVLRTGSIWGAVVIHTLFNLAGDLPELLPDTMVESGGLTAFFEVWSVAVYLPFILLAAWVLIKCTKKANACMV